MKKTAFLPALLVVVAATASAQAQTVPQMIATEAPGAMSPPAADSLTPPSMAAPAPAPATATQQAAETDPQNILSAPPGENQAVDYSWTEYKNPYAGEQNSLENPNRTSDEVTAWAQRVTTDALTFAPETLNQQIAEAKKYFIERGWTEYAAYIREAKFLERIRGQNLSVNTVMNGTPAVLGADAVAGAYRWLVEAPILITFLKKDMNGEQTPSGTGKFKLTLQIARVENGKGDDGMAIEGWKVASAE